MLVEASHTTPSADALSGFGPKKILKQAALAASGPWFRVPRVPRPEAANGSQSLDLKGAPIVHRVPHLRFGVGAWVSRSVVWGSGKMVRVL